MLKLYSKCCRHYDADASMKSEGKKRVLLTGTCWYELAGLRHLLSVQGYDVCYVLPGNLCAPDDCDLAIVALSAEPVAGWGRYLPWICGLREKVSGEMLVLVPERLKSLKILQNVNSIYSGRENLQRLSFYIDAALTREPVHTDRFSLTESQRRVLKRFSEGDGGKDEPLNQFQNKPWLYRQYARLAEYAGVRNFRMLTLAGLDKEIIRMEKIQNIN